MDRMYVIITNCIFPGDEKERRKSLDHDEDRTWGQLLLGHSVDARLLIDSLTPDLIPAEPF